MRAHKESSIASNTERIDIGIPSPGGLLTAFKQLPQAESVHRRWKETYMMHYTDGSPLDPTSEQNGVRSTSLKLPSENLPPVHFKVNIENCGGETGRESNSKWTACQEL